MHVRLRMPQPAIDLSIDCFHIIRIAALRAIRAACVDVAEECLRRRARGDTERRSPRSRARAMDDLAFEARPRSALRGSPVYVSGDHAREYYSGPTRLSLLDTGTGS